ncbi:molybdopterin-dependent oxidoreductase [uncultured Methanobrevibacter sp.]|uniref:molybdopterin-dependent oxidoreductase n=1 Tax=uncultured Methanobrevibacter sp. TaxID=253161 RepID=UPI002600203A|nr:molybdopterin-dependent oxidoreductase [uncultured Methanobrevibacter sp.]
MLDIKHTICPSCSVGCGLNIVSKDGAVVGTYPYKRHPINEGKNCLNGRNSILQFDNQIENPSIVKNGELEESDYETVFKLIKDQLASIDASELAIICSGNSTNEELDRIKEFADGFGCEKIGFYGYNFPNFAVDVASYDDIAGAKTILAIGDIYRENPLLARRIVLSKENGACLINLDDVEKSITSLNADEFIQFDGHLGDKIDAVKGKLDENSIIIANKVCCKDDFALLESLAGENGAKLLPVFNAPNMKGAMNKLDSWDVEEVKNIIGDSKVLIVVKDNPFEYLSKDDIKGKAFIVNISNEDNAFAKISDVILPGKSWGEKAGTFTNCEGLEQSFDISAEIENDNLGEVEILDELA